MSAEQLAHTGLRLGEAIALQWGDVDLTGRAIRVARTISGRREGTPKSGHGRAVDVSRPLAEALRHRLAQRKVVPFPLGGHEPPAWVFTRLTGRAPLDRYRTE
jgi:integrase